jgi:DNA repair photolyase
MFNGKVIYNPSGKAGEYSEWAANFYNGCSARCAYCYNRHGVVAGVLGGDVPTLKKCLGNTAGAIQLFIKEFNQNVVELRKSGLFFNFVSDPFLPETIQVNTVCMRYCLANDVPVKILTKQTAWVNEVVEEMETRGTLWNLLNIKRLISFGFTLTGRDELEPGAATNAERIDAMKKLHAAGFKTWASIEPVITIPDSLHMIKQSKPYCDFFKIGLKSGDKYHYEIIREFLDEVFEMLEDKPFYLKDSLLKQAGVARDSFDLPINCVDRNFNL